MILGLYFASYPGESNHPEWANWSNNLTTLGKNYVFPNHAELARFWPALGMHMFTLGVIFCAPAKRLFAHPKLVWLGNVSFALYLLHGPLLRGPLAWILLGLQTPTIREGKDAHGEPTTYLRYPLPGKFVFILVLPIFYAFMLWCSYLFTLYVDPFCIRVSTHIEDFLFGRNDNEEDKV
jgi:hypothetical protein